MSNVASTAVDPELAKWVTRARARTGATVCVRPLRPDDREREIEFINSLSERTRYLRMFTPLKFLSRHLLDQLMDIDYRQRMAFVATVELEGVERVIGVTRYAAADEAATAELGITISDAWQRCGIARLLMEQLMRYAHAHGIRRLTGLVLPENHAMIALARRLGFTVSYDPTQHLFQIARDLRDVQVEPPMPDPGLPGASRSGADECSDRASVPASQPRSGPDLPPGAPLV